MLVRAQPKPPFYWTVNINGKCARLLSENISDRTRGGPPICPCSEMAIIEVCETSDSSSNLDKDTISKASRISTDLEVHVAGGKDAVKFRDRIICLRSFTR